jgi:hypothetical protein
VPFDAYILLFVVVLIYSKHKICIGISINMPKTRRWSHDQQIAWRRQRVLTWVATGKQPYEIANELQVSETTIKRDLAFLQSLAQQEIKDYVQNRLPFEYTKSLAVLDHIKMRAFKIADETRDDRNKITALRLAAETEVSKARLLAEGPGVVALTELQERLKKVENHQFLQELRRQLPLTQ